MWKIKINLLFPCSVDRGTIYFDENAAKEFTAEQSLGKKNYNLRRCSGIANNIDLILRQQTSARAAILYSSWPGTALSGNIEQRIENENLQNVRLLDPIQKIGFAALSVSDICLVTLLDIPVFKGAIPTKLIDYMECERPVISNVDGEARRILDAADAGIFIEEADGVKLASSICDMLNDHRNTVAMGKRGKVTRNRCTIK